MSDTDLERSRTYGACVLDLTPYKDPDEFIKGLGAQALEERIRKAMSSFMFQVKVAAGRYDQDDPESKTQFQHEAAKLLATIEEPCSG